MSRSAIHTASTALNTLPIFHTCFMLFNLLQQQHEGDGDGDDIVDEEFTVIEVQEFLCLDSFRVSRAVDSAYVSLNVVTVMGW